MLTPKNQTTQSGLHVCPLCQVTDVTIRYIRISHAGGGMQLATSLSDATATGPGAPALAGERWSIHDVVLDDLNPKYLGGGGAFEIANSWPTNALNNVTINHVTALTYPDAHMMLIGNLQSNHPMSGLVFTNNLIVTGNYPVWNTGGGPTSCAYKDVPVTTVTNCFTTFTFENNGLITAPSRYPPSSWPANNKFPQTIDEVGFVNFNNGNGGNYELQPSSPYKNKGVDGKDLGADIVGLNAALANVE